MQNFALLNSLRKNIDPKEYYTHEKYVHEYESILSDIEKFGYDISKFKIPEAELANQIATFNVLSERKTYKDFREVETVLFITKMDGLLDFFSLIIKEPKRQIGFNQ